MKIAVCTIKFYYDPETYLYDTDDEPPTNEEVIRRCREMMLEDITDQNNLSPGDAISVEFEEVP